METQRHPYTTRPWCSESHAHALLCSLQMRSCQVVTSTYINKYVVFSPEHIRLPIKILFLQGINKQLEFGNPALVLSTSAPRGPPLPHTHTRTLSLTHPRHVHTQMCTRTPHTHTWMHTRPSRKSSNPGRGRGNLWSVAGRSEPREQSALGLAWGRVVLGDRPSTSGSDSVSGQMVSGSSYIVMIGHPAGVRALLGVGKIDELELVSKSLSPQEAGTCCPLFPGIGQKGVRRGDTGWGGLSRRGSLWPQLFSLPSDCWVNTPFVFS